MRVNAILVIGSQSPLGVRDLAQRLDVPLRDIDEYDPAPFPSIAWTDDETGRTISRREFTRVCRHVTAWREIAAGDGFVLVLDEGTDVADRLPDALATFPDEPSWGVALLAADAAAYLCTPGAARALLEPVVLDDAIPLESLLASVAFDVVRVDPPLATPQRDPIGEARGDDRAEASHLVLLAVDARRELPEALADLDPRSLVVAVPHDHVVVGDVDELLATYASIAAGLVVVAASTVPPASIEPSLLDEHPEPDTPFRYVAGVGIAGQAATMVDALVGRDEDDDAIALTTAYLEGLVALDSSCALFHVPEAPMTAAVAVHHRLMVPATDTTPPVVVAGRDREAFASVRDALADDGARDLARIFRYDDAVDPSSSWSMPAAEIVQIPFWTPELCASIIRLAEAAEAWDRDEDDPVPGVEVSLSALSPRLVGHLRVHVDERVRPVLRSVWPEMAETELHDAFVIRYAPGPHGELRLHHDVAQISGSVRLNAGYRGGRLEFPRQGWDNGDVPVGHLVVWPSLVTHPHQSTPVTAGVKYGVTLWWELPR